MVFPNRPINSYTYTWNKKWVSRYESPWSILTKFQYVNSISSKAILKRFGTEKVRNLKQDVDKNLYTLKGFDQTLLENALEMPLMTENKEFLFRLLDPLTHNELIRKKNLVDLHFMRLNLTYCPICMKKPYHSTLHQFRFVQRCPFHFVPLIKECPKCKMEIPYILEDRSYSSPYICQCGYHFADLDKRLNTISMDQMKDYNLSKWLYSGKQYKERLSALFIFEEFETNPSYTDHDFNYELSDLFNFLNKSSHTVTTKEKLDQTKSIEQLIAIRVNKLGKSFYAFYDGKESRLEDFQKESYFLCNQIFNSIARHMRKTILRKHIPCIKQFTRSGGKLQKSEMCPYAISYTFWRLGLQEFEEIEYVDNFGIYPFSRKHYTAYGFPINNGFYFINEFINEYKKHYENKRAVFHWIINHFVSELIMAHFKRCLVATKKFFKTNKFDTNYLRSYDFIPRMMGELPSENDGKCFMYVKHNSSIEELTKHFLCPNSTVKKRRGPNQKYVKVHPLKAIFDKM